MANHVGAAGARFAATMTQSTNRLIVTLGAPTGTVNTGVVDHDADGVDALHRGHQRRGRRLSVPGGHRVRHGGRRLLAMARLRRISTGGILALAVNALLALTALGIAFGAPGGGDEPRLKLAAAGGSLTLVNSKEGEAVFTAGAMRPGGQASGTVQITNSGSVPGALSVDRAADPLETPGDGGGLLSARLELRGHRRHAGVRPGRRCARASWRRCRTLGVGTIPPGEQRAYRFEATMAHGADDNAFQGASLSAGFTWTAVGSERRPPRPRPPPPRRSPTATPEPAAPRHARRFPRRPARSASRARSTAAAPRPSSALSCSRCPPPGAA